MRRSTLASAAVVLAGCGLSALGSMEDPDASTGASSSSSSSGSSGASSGASSSGADGDGSVTTDATIDSPSGDASGDAAVDAPTCAAMEVVCAGACCRGFCADDACKKPILWLRGDDAVGGATFNWPDRSGNGNDVKQSSDGLKPNIPGAVVNGHKIVRFPNSARLVATNAFQPGTGDVVWFHVSNNAGSNAVQKNQVFGTLLDVDPFSGITAGYDMQNHPYGMFRQNTDVFITGSSLAINGSWNVIDMRRTGGNAELRRNGTSLMTGAANMNVNGGVFIVGSERATGTEFFNGDIAEIVLFGATFFSDAQRSSVAQQLGALYGITVQ